ncbi:hypothetical protein OIU80_10165 [Flavobacterium sp. LS1R47]|jgi:hypothetical protein|uniref:Uncharacterized protein n=1 Tax=Flavobacterium frigoritolerans TaxID=2987686 RepID=A0A9X2ZMT4_9FLAO|nr:hypothetical protein [Flavobacterium frigoritolerans]MCV9932647.1 hypothetical protein [Flavobacterium frigoritolerans]
MKSIEKAPKIIREAKSINHPIDFKWNGKIMEKLIDPAENHNKLELALTSISYKASLGLTAALLEWIYWRYKNRTESSQEMKQRIEALWCSISHPEYTKPLVFDLNMNAPASGPIDGPLWVALMNVRMIDVLRRNGSYNLQSEIVGLVLLVRHTTPKKKKFNKWLKSNLKRLNLLFPCQYTYDDYNNEEAYNPSEEPVICRDFFFDPLYKYTIKSSEIAIKTFVARLDYETNPFLCFPKEAS